MKKVLFLAIIIFVLIFCFSYSSFSLKELLVTKELCEVSSQIDLGFIKEEYVNENYSIYSNGDEIVGEVVRLNINKNSLNKILEKIGFMVVKRYEVDGIKIIEGWASKIKFGLKGRQSNVQVAIKNQEIVIGSPIIYGSY